MGARYTIVAQDGHTVDTAGTPAEAENKSWWRENVTVIDNTTQRSN